MDATSQREFPYTRQDFDFLRRIAHERTGIVVGDDKFDMFYARLSRRLRQLGLGSFGDYCQYLRKDPHGQEALELVNAITTNLTAFFRERHHFDYLADEIVPEFLRQHPGKAPFRIWSAGCSTGEEPYSLAMTLLDRWPGHRRDDLHIHATDIDSNVLANASAGIYPQERVRDLPRPLLKRWFLRGTGTQAGKVRVKPELKRPLAFSQLNLLAPWHWDDPMHVIFCRNVIIYFGQEDKARLVNRFADALVDGGYLFIGHSETLNRTSDRFELIGRTIYRKGR